MGANAASPARRVTLSPRREDGELAVEDDEGLVLPVVDVQRGHLAARAGQLDDAERVIALLRRHEDASEIDEEARGRPVAVAVDIFELPSLDSRLELSYISIMELCQATR